MHQRLSTLASYVDRRINERFYEALLDAFQSEAEALGFEFVADDMSNYGVNVGDGDLPYDVAQKLGKAVLRARIKFLAPRASDEKIEHDVDLSEPDGDAEAWTEQLLGTLRERGIVIRRRDQAFLH